MNRCACEARTDTPAGMKWWHPEREPDPGLHVVAVVRFGDDPAMRRWERVPGGWSQRGHMVDYYIDRTPPTAWEDTGRCWAGRLHTVVPVWRKPDGSWTFDDPHNEQGQARAMSTGQRNIDKILLSHHQDEQGKCVKCETVWPCEVFIEATATRTASDEGGNGAGQLKLVDQLPWRGIVYLANAAGRRTNRVVFCCVDADDAAEKVVKELEDIRRTKADRLGGPEAVCGEAKIVDPDRRTVRRCYLFSKEEALEWDDRTADEQPRSG